MRRSFSVEDLLDEVEKICYDASGTSKVRHKFLSHVSEAGKTLLCSQTSLEIVDSVF